MIIDRIRTDELHAKDNLNFMSHYFQNGVQDGRSSLNPKCAKIGMRIY